LISFLWTRVVVVICLIVKFRKQGEEDIIIVMGVTNIVQIMCMVCLCYKMGNTRIITFVSNRSDLFLTKNYVSKNHTLKNERNYEYIFMKSAISTRE